MASLAGTILVENRPADSLKPDPENPRRHSPEQINQIDRAICEFGWTVPILADEVIRAGHGRQLAALQIYGRGETIRLPNDEELPAGCVPVIDCTGWSEAQKRAYVIADNQLTIAGEWDEAKLRAQVEGLIAMDFDMEAVGLGDEEIARMRAAANEEPGSGRKLGSLSDEFLIPPFSVLNAREGWWQDRKRAWLALGIESELGRGDNLLRMSETILEPDPAKRAEAKRRAGTKPIPAGPNFGEIPSYDGAERTITGTSIFDPVLCELAYRWFCPPKGTILDPFAGGSVRGIVAAALGRPYWGIDLRQEQGDANAQQWDRIRPERFEDAPHPMWVIGDSLAVLQGEGDGADFIFSCPPYGDLEKYSDDPADLSNLDPEAFDAAYAQIIKLAVVRLRPDRFAAFVVGDYRDKRGVYRDFISKTIAAFREAGAQLYNEIILITAAGSLAIRAGKQFRTTRKVGKTHQQLLVFIKGDPRKATEACGPVDVEAALAQFAEEIEGAGQADSSGEEEGTFVKISAACARQLFTQCGPKCIELNGCKGNCCDAPGRPSGCLITINPREQERIEGLGGVVEEGLLQPRAGERGCPFKKDGLCSIHEIGKPFGCTASPFTLNRAGTLIIRNRYRMLPCYRGPGEKGPAYVVFRASLDIIFGHEEAERICDHLAAGGGDLMARIDPDIRAELIENDEIKKAAKLGGEVA